MVAQPASRLEERTSRGPSRHTLVWTNATLVWPNNDMVDVCAAQGRPRQWYKFAIRITPHFVVARQICSATGAITRQQADAIGKVANLNARQRNAIRNARRRRGLATSELLRRRGIVLVLADCRRDRTSPS